MKIIIVAPIDPVISLASGVRTYTINLISQLKKHGVTPILMGFSHSNDTTQEFDFEFVPVVSKKNSGYKFITYLFFKIFFFKIGSNTVIHVQRPDYLLPFILFHRHNPKVCTLHGAHIKNVLLKKNYIIGFIYGLLEKFALNHADKIIMVSSETQKYYCEKYPYLEEKFILIPNGIDIDIFKPIITNNYNFEKYGIDCGEKTILYVGRLEKEKRVDCIIRVFKELQGVLADSKLIIVGDGKEKKSLEMLTIEYNLKNVFFIHSLKQEKISKLMNCADVLILCSIHEGMPTVVLEALACGLPVVSTDVGDVNQVITPRTGRIFKNINSTEVRDIILEVLSGNKISKDACVEISKRYSWPGISKRIIEVYYEVLEEN